ncbi:MAG TPA: hypothetical protein VGE34_04685 [Candidatus Saccharimonadales bacterium]
MTRKAWRLTRIAAIAVLFVAIGLTLQGKTANAEGNFSFPRVTSQNSQVSKWGFNSNSPDPNLTWLYKGSGTEEGKTTHILRNRSIGHNKGTRLRAYFISRPQNVSITINVVACELSADNPYDGNVIVRLGGGVKYNQPTIGRDIEVAKDRYNWQNVGQGSNTRPYTLVYKDTQYDTRKRNNSPVCQNFSNKYDRKRYEEGCSDRNNNRCANNGNENFSFDKNLSQGTVPADGGSFGKAYAVGNALDGRTFSTTNISRDPDTGLYFVDIDVDLDSQEENGLPVSVMQRITFNVKARATGVNGNALTPMMGYRKDPTIPDAQLSRYFGLQGNGGRENTFSDYGQKFALPFGMNCSDRSPTVKGRIYLYDVDAGFGNVYARVYERDPGTKVVNELPKNRYDTFGNASADYVDSGNAAGFILAKGTGSDKNSVFAVTMKRGYQYMLVVVNPNQKAPPATNVFSVLLPSDSIKGLIDCRQYLDPHINDVDVTFAASGDVLTPRGSIENKRPTAQAGDHKWRISRAVFSSKPSGLTRAGTAYSNLSQCAFIASTAGAYTECKPDLYEGTYPDDLNKTVNDSVGPYDLGSYVCYITSIEYPRWDKSEKWAYSQMMCSLAGRAPKVQIRGHDLKAPSGTITTSLQTKDSKTYGSWGEYGILASGCIAGNKTSSGADLSGGSATKTPTPSWHALTFANAPPATPCSGEYGKFGTIPPYNVDALGLPTPTSTDTGVIDIDGINISNSDLASKRKQILYYPNATVRITDDIKYSGSFSSVNKLPRVIIVAKNIIINNNVKQIDAWLVAKKKIDDFNPGGNIATCALNDADGNFSEGASFSNATQKKVDTCPEQLTFNGAVIAENRIFLHRTGGSEDDDVGKPAEIFNLRPDIFLASLSSTDNPVATTDMITELPPRF